MNKFLVSILLIFTFQVNATENTEWMRPKTGFGSNTEIFYDYDNDIICYTTSRGLSCVKAPNNQYYQNRKSNFLKKKELRNQLKD